LYNAINSRLSDDPDQFWHVVAFADNAKRLKFPRYYSHFSPGEYKWDEKRWLWKPSVGFEFGADGKIDRNKPIIFVRFSSSDGNYLCRVPLSVATIMESRAEFTERELEAALLSVCSDAAEQEKVIHSLKRTRYISLWNKEMAEYNAALHLVANLQGVTEASMAHILCNKLGNLSLNFPTRFFENLPTPSPLKGNTDEALSLKKLRDPGLVFFVLCEFGSRTTVSEPDSWLEQALNSAGLPTLKEVTNECTKEMDELNTAIVEGPEAPRLRSVLDVGRRNFSQQGILGKSIVIDFFNDYRLLLPPVLTQDRYIVGLSKNMAESPANHGEWRVRAIGSQSDGSILGYQYYLEEFLDACGRTLPGEWA
jgi:hypothetical protein